MYERFLIPHRFCTESRVLIAEGWFSFPYPQSFLIWLQGLKLAECNQLDELKMRWH